MIEKILHLDNGKYLTVSNNHVIDYITKLNQSTISEITENIEKNISNHKKYLNDINNNPVIINYPIFSGSNQHTFDMTNIPDYKPPH